MTSETDTDKTQTPVSELTRAQRRVLGVLVEKGITTPEVYPLTLKAATAGCNQKSNRDPVVNYDEEKVERVLDELRELGLVAQVHTESGRTARYRHYMRHQFTLTEPQLAILTELLLRGRQSLGELRTRAGRMAPIDSLDQLKQELHGLISQKFVESDGSLERRGAEVDHTFYPPGEHRPIRETTSTDRAESSSHTSGSDGAVDQDLEEVTSRFESLEQRLAGLESERDGLLQRVSHLEQELRTLRDALGA